jgi:hypothetical protein
MVRLPSGEAAYPYGEDRGLAIGARPGGSQAASLAGAVFQFQGSN